jgi:hypothetical protein
LSCFVLSAPLLPALADWPQASRRRPLDPPLRAFFAHALRRSRHVGSTKGQGSNRNVPATVTPGRACHDRLIRAARLPAPGSFAFSPSVFAGLFRAFLPVVKEQTFKKRKGKQ